MHAPTQSRIVAQGPVWLLLAVVAGTSGSALFLTGDQAAVAMPALAAILCLGVFYAFVWRRSRELPVLEIGVFYAFVVMVYAVVPLTGYLLKGMHYGTESDSRLMALQPSVREVAGLGWQNALYLMLFAGAYAFWRPSTGVPDRNQRLSQVPAFSIVLALVALLSAYSVLSWLLYPEQTGTYTGTYLRMQAAPLIVRQMANHLDGMSVVATMVLLITLFVDFRRRRFWIVALLVYEAVVTLSSMGARTDLVQYVVAAAMLYHRFVKPLRFHQVAAFIILGLSGTLAYGVVRNAGPDGSGLRLDSSLLTSSNEFESIFGTGLELNRLRSEDLLPPIPPQLYIADFVGMVPQQLLPFDKMEFGEWYMETFHPDAKERGEGYAFGVVSESAVGLGWIELSIRALALAFVLARLHIWYTRRSAEFWVVALYLWLCLCSYQAFRQTSFIVLVYFLYRFLPFYVVMRYLDRIRHRHGARHISAAFNG